MSDAPLKNIKGGKSELGRRLYSRKDAGRCRRGKTRPGVFYPPSGGAEISVDMLDIVGDETIAEKAAADEVKRDGPFRGWAAVSHSNACAQNRKVKEDPLPENPYHALIVFPDEAKHDKNIYDSHASDLAQNAHWRESPLTPARE